MAAVAAGLDSRNHLVLLGVGNSQFEILDLVPVMGVGLAHHGLGPLLVDVVVAGGTDLGFFIVVVGAGSVSGITDGCGICRQGRKEKGTGKSRS
jgi:hypothetical protein